ncbi:MAG: metallophosphoesterase [Clostridia bacterium]|nr:metallophosphoesterase [Clostridia bacterium]
MKNRPSRICLSALLLVLLLCAALTAGACSRADNPEETGTETSAAPASEAPTAPDTQPDTPPATVPDTEPDTEPETAPAPDYAGLVDFVVDVEAGRDIRVLQLTDPQIIDSGQCRTPDRLNAVETALWATDKMETGYKQYIRQLVTETKPDFIFITGDVVYGEFDDNGSVLLDFIDFMEGFGIPWAPVFGNHDNESHMGADWQCQQLEEAEHCLFLQRELTGNGNYTVGLTQGGKLVRVFFMLDSNGCGNMSAESKANGHSTTSVGIASDQAKWFIAAADDIRAASPETKISFAFHIQPDAFTAAFSKYGFSNSGTQGSPINIDKAADKADTDFGYLGRDLKSPWSNSGIWKKLLATGADSVFCGHEHCNSGSVVVDGVRYQYGMKSSIYDRINYEQSDGTIVGGYELPGTPLIGGTMMLLAEGTGEIKDAHIVYADTEEIKPEPEPDKPDAKYVYVLDFNGRDFDITVTTDGLNREPVAAVYTEAVDGAEGLTARAIETYLVSVGVKFGTDVPYDVISSIRVRMRVTENTKHSKDPLFRLYNDRNNQILTTSVYATLGSFGEWTEIELSKLLKDANLVKNGLIQPFSMVYRCYDAQTLVEFDCLILETSEEIPGLPVQAEEHEAA